MDPVDFGEHVVGPTGTVADLKCGCFLYGHGSHHSTSRVLQDHNGSTMQLAVHEQVILSHVLLHDKFVLVGILASNDQVVLTGDEPVELLEPEGLATELSLLHHVNLVLLEVPQSSLLSRGNSNISSLLRLVLLLTRLLLDLEVLLDVELG